MVKVAQSKEITTTDIVVKGIVVLEVVVVVVGEFGGNNAEATIKTTTITITKRIAN